MPGNSSNNKTDRRRSKQTSSAVFELGKAIPTPLSTSLDELLRLASPIRAVPTHRVSLTPSQHVAVQHYCLGHFVRGLPIGRLARCFRTHRELDTPLCLWDLRALFRRAKHCIEEQ